MLIIHTGTSYATAAAYFCHVNVRYSHTEWLEGAALLLETRNVHIWRNSLHKAWVKGRLQDVLLMVCVSCSAFAEFETGMQKLPFRLLAKANSCSPYTFSALCPGHKHI